MVYGLVAPGYTMAEVAADQPARRREHFHRRRHLDQAQADGRRRGAASATPSPVPKAPSRSRSTTRSRAPTPSSWSRTTPRRCSAACWSVTPSKYAVLRPMVGRPLSGDPVAMIAPERRGRRRHRCAARRRAGLLVPRGDQGPRSARAISDNGLTDVAGIKACTKAGTGCGSCVPLLKTLLAESGVAVSTALCEHFSQTRAELFDIVRVAGITSFTELIERHGTRPRLRHLQAGGRLDPGQRSTKGTSSTASRQRCRTPTTTSWPTSRRTAPTRVVPRIAGGEITPEKADRDRRGGARLRPLHQDHRRPADRPVRRPRRAAAGDLEAPGRRRVRVRPRLRQGAAYGEVVRRLDLVPLRRAGLGGAGDRARAALPRHPVAAQDQGRASAGAPASAPRRRARTSASSPPRTAGTSTSAATAASGRGTPTCCSPTSTPRR